MTALAPTLTEARERAYRGVRAIRWDGSHYRSDIALDAVETLERRGTT